jgi:hypothetical protein
MTAAGHDVAEAGQGLRAKIQFTVPVSITPASLVGSV